MDQTFEELHAQYLPKIKRLARQHLPGMSTGEVQCEIELALWTAWKKYDPDRGASFDTLFYTAWMSRKSHVWESFHSHRRRMFDTMLHGDLADEWHGEHEGVQPHVLPYTEDVYDCLLPCPVDGWLARKVWLLLANGSRKVDVLAILGISRREYDRIIRDFRDSYPA